MEDHNGQELLLHLSEIHTTPMGVERIKRNLNLDCGDVVWWCQEQIKRPEAVISRKGKNWYVETAGCIITVNAYSYTIITAHQEKRMIYQKSKGGKYNGKNK